MNELQLNETQRGILVTELNRTLPFLVDHIAAANLMKISTEHGPYTYSYERQRVFAEINEKQIKKAILDTLSGEPVVTDKKGEFTQKIEKMLEEGASEDEFAEAFIQANEVVIKMYKNLLQRAEIKEFGHAINFFHKFLGSVQHHNEAMIEIRDRLQMEEAHKSFGSLVATDSNDSAIIEAIVTDVDTPADIETDAVRDDASKDLIDKPENAVEGLSGVDNDEQIQTILDDATELAGVDTDNEHMDGPTTGDADTETGEPVNAVEGQVEASNSDAAQTAEADTGADEPVEVAVSSLPPATTEHHIEIEEIAAAPQWNNTDAYQADTTPAEEQPIFQVSLDKGSESEAAVIETAAPSPAEQPVEELVVEADNEPGYIDTKGRRIMLVKRAS